MNRPRPTPDQLEEMAMAYLLGALDGDEARDFERLRAERDPEVLALLEQNRATADALLLAGPAVPPPPDLKARILTAARTSSAGDASRGATPPQAAAPSSPPLGAVVHPLPSRGRPLWTGLAFAAAAGLALVSWQALELRQRLATAERAAAVARERATEMAGELEALKLSAARQAELVRLLEDPASGLVTLAALKPAPGASARVLWDAKARKGYLWVRNLPADGAEHDYQLWALGGDRPVSAGVFGVSADGSALVPLDTLGLTTPVGAFAITLEPAGGLPAPTGEILLLGNVGG